MFGPVAATSPNSLSENILSACFAGLCVVLLGVLWVRSLLRERQLKQLSFERGWIWLSAGNWQVPIRELLGVPEHDIRLENGLKGAHGGVCFSACDCVIGSGKHRSYISVIAVRADTNPFGLERWSSDFRVHRADGWFAVTLEQKILGQRIMSASEMLSIIESIGKAADSL